MTTEKFAEFLAVNLWAVLVVIALGMLLVAGLLWHGLQRYGGRIVALLCVGFSRVALQVHYFSDVLGGYAVGVAWVAAWIADLEVFRRRQSTTGLSGTNI